MPSRALIVHGHFYQPPRENPWTGIVDVEPSAAPFRDWNERIYLECYRPNGRARIVDGRGATKSIVDNYQKISWNFGPTLLSWMEREHPSGYARLIQSDHASRALYGGHGNAIAQGYNHTILALSNERDRRTQVRWGLADFKSRFGRDAEAMWLPETACNNATLETLIEHGLRWVLLAPHQAKRVRPIGQQDWTATPNANVDTSKAYVWRSARDASKSIAVFFYDGGISRAIAFERLLTSSEAFVARLAQGARQTGPLVHVATDGETYGHHFKFGDRALAYALQTEAEKYGLAVTNYSQFLDHYPPQDEVELEEGELGEGTSWSCAHGVGRWIRDCGCHTGGQDGWNQAWRTPLRHALDVLRDEADRFFENAGADLFRDPWEARNDYIQVILGRDAALAPYFERHARKPLSDGETRRARALLELQRHVQLSYTSCGWFFSDPSGIETLQVLRYAGRALDLMDEAGGTTPRAQFMEVLAEARSNIAKYGSAADLFNTQVLPSRRTAQSIVAHLAIEGLDAQPPAEGELAQHRFQVHEWKRDRRGDQALATGRIRVESVLTGKSATHEVAALHLGGIDHFAMLRDGDEPAAVKARRESVWKAFDSGSTHQLFRASEAAYGGVELGLEAVLPQAREVISQRIFSHVVTRLCASLADAYEEHRGTIESLEGLGFTLPPALATAANYTLHQRFEDEIRNARQDGDRIHFFRTVTLAQEALARGVTFSREFAKEIFGTMIEEVIEDALAAPQRIDVNLARNLVDVARTLGLSSRIEHAEELLYDFVRAHGAPSPAFAELALAFGLSPELFLNANS